ncbi:LamG domain-containing protein [Telmatobacter bradus]|uniref:LamG domain-containing protein n=1 Tax=Telmatobacter bradus TaxID=474953 RepID=UPI003B4398E8
MRRFFCTAFMLFVVLSCALLASHAQATPQPPAPQPEQTWRFDNLSSIGGHPVQVVGHPELIGTPYGKAVQFHGPGNGQGDGIFVPAHPLAGASTYTWEVIFRPDADGPQAQRFFHLQEQNPDTGEDTPNRMLFEIRIVDGQWCLDSYAKSNASYRTLLNCKALHPLGQWYRMAVVYDGHMLRNYVDGELQGEGELTLTPQLAGRSSVGMRINNRDPFKGAILLSRTVPRALTPAEFLPMSTTCGGTDRFACHLR